MLCAERCRVCNHDLDAWFSLGLVNGRLDKLAEASSCFHHILAIDPHNAGACYNLGKLCSLQGEFVQAEQYYRRAIKFKNDLA